MALRVLAGWGRSRAAASGLGWAGVVAEGCGNSYWALGLVCLFVILIVVKYR